MTTTPSKKTSTRSRNIIFFQFSKLFLPIIAEICILKRIYAWEKSQGAGKLEEEIEKIYRHKPVDELTFTDDGMFQAVMHNPEICTEVIERLLHVKVKDIKYPEIEKVILQGRVTYPDACVAIKGYVRCVNPAKERYLELLRRGSFIEPYYTTKSIRLDVHLKDMDKVIDVECQTYRQDAIGKRTRFYQSLIDTDSLMKGQDYSELQDSYILFICKDDPFKISNENGYGLPCYTFKNTCIENSDVELNDKTLKVIYNASAYKGAKDDKIRSFLHFVSTNEPGEDDFSKRIAELVEQKKLNEEFRSLYAAMNLHDRDITRMAKEQKALEAAENLIKLEKLTVEQIAQSMGLPLETVKQLAEKLKIPAHA